MDQVKIYALICIDMFGDREIWGCYDSYDKAIIQKVEMESRYSDVFVVDDPYVLNQDYA